MTDRYQTEPFAPNPEEPGRPIVLAVDQPQLPQWLAERILRDYEQVNWVRGPRFTPSWEILVTHPGLLLFTLPLAALCLFVGWLVAGSWAHLSPVAFLAAMAVVIGSIFVLGAFSGHFTRLVVTNLRLFIVQGRELCSSWDLDDLPPHLIRYTRTGDGERGRSVDLDAVKTMLGGSDKFTEAKSIVEFGKKLDQITLREKRRP